MNYDLIWEGFDDNGDMLTGTIFRVSIEELDVRIESTRVSMETLSIKLSQFHLVPSHEMRDYTFRTKQEN